MVNTARIVFVGATSMSFGLSMLRDVVATTQLAGSTLVLVARDETRLTRTAELARLLIKRTGAGVNVEQTIDRRAALDGADFVFNSTAVDRNRLWKLDFEVPRKHGIRHTLGENGGPGAVFFTLRTLPLVFDLAREMEEICPHALLINFSNPESRIVLALGKYSPIRNIGLCHGIFMAQENVARIMGLPPSQVDVWAAGLNHIQCLMQIRDKETGADLVPLLREKERSYDPSFNPLTRKLFRGLGYWLGCDDSHIGEYLSYGWEGGEGGYNFIWDEEERVKFAKQVEGVLAGTMEVPAKWLTASGERGVAVIAGILHNQKRLIESAIVSNHGVIPNLADDAAVEVPIVVDAAGAHPVSLGPLPDAVAKLLAVQVDVAKLSVDAAVHASKELALHALLIDPVVNSADAAVAILDELWKANRPYIRKCV